MGGCFRQGTCCGGRYNDRAVVGAGAEERWVNDPRGTEMYVGIIPIRRDIVNVEMFNTARFAGNSTEFTAIDSSYSEKEPLFRSCMYRSYSWSSLSISLRMIVS
jgi:hypothetical protein